MKITAELLLLASGPIFVMAIFLEQLFYKKQHPEWFDLKDTLNNMVLALLQQGAEIFAVAINLFFQFWIHTELTSRIPYFDYWFNTPSHHRVHHATNPQYIDKNYGGVLIIWDRIFGTFIPEIEKCRYGITKEVNFRDPWSSNFSEFKDMVQEALKEKTMKNKLLRIFAPPDWNP